MRVGTAWAVLVAAILASAVLSAQDGAIVGRVLDQAGDPLPGTTIEVVGPALAEPRVGVTDLEGRYRITGLPPGTYAVTLRLPGFGSAFRDGVVVGAGLAPRVDAELVVGEMDYLGDGVDLDARSPAGSGGAIALECMFLPSGAIVNCRRVDVVGQLSPHWR